MADKRGRKKGQTVASGAVGKYRKPHPIRKLVLLNRWLKRNPSKGVMFDLAGAKVLTDAIGEKGNDYKDKLEGLVALRDEMVRRELDNIK